MPQTQSSDVGSTTFKTKINKEIPDADGKSKAIRVNNDKRLLKTGMLQIEEK